MHDRNVITGSGITFIIIYILSLFVLLFLEKFSFVKLEYPNRFYILNFVLVFFSLMSFYDDLKNLHPNIRFFVQLLLVSLSIPLINTEFLNTYFPLKIIIFFLVFYWVYLINIINFIDGLDGFLIFIVFLLFNSLHIFTIWILVIFLLTFYSFIFDQHFILYIQQTTCKNIYG